MSKFSAGEAVGFGWNALKENFKTLMLMVLSYVVFIIVFALAEKVVDKMAAKFFFAVVLFLVNFIINMLLSIFIVKATLDLHDKKTVRFDSFFKNFQFFWPMLGVSLLSTSIISIAMFCVVGTNFILAYAANKGNTIILGIIFFALIIAEIVAVVWIMLSFSFALYLVIDKNLGPINAMKKSARLVHGSRWSLIWLVIVMFGVILLGVVCLLLGVLAAIPICWMAYAYVYRKFVPLQAPETGVQIDKVI